MHCNFYIGQRVVCVNADPKAVTGNFNGEMDGLAEGQAYTVRGIVASPPEWDKRHPKAANQIWIHLKEIRRDSFEGIEVGYVHWRFRPTTDISSLEALLVGKKVPEPEHV